MYTQNFAHGSFYDCWTGIKIFISIGSREATRARIISEVINHEKFLFFISYQENRAEKNCVQ